MNIMNNKTVHIHLLLKKLHEGKTRLLQSDLSGTLAAFLQPII